MANSLHYKIKKLVPKGRRDWTKLLLMAAYRGNWSWFTETNENRSGYIGLSSRAFD